MNLIRNRRLQWLCIAYFALSLTILGRLMALEARDGDAYRAAGAEPIVRRHETPAVRGRILANDGAVLAFDEPSVALAVDYRWLEEPPNPRWLRQMARAKLSAAERRNMERIQEAEAKVVEDRRDLAIRLAQLSAMDERQWQRRAGRIQQQVESIASTVNARHAATDRVANDIAEADRDEDGFFSVVGQGIVKALFRRTDPPRSAPLTILEEVSEHVMQESLTLDVVAEIEAHPSRYPGVKLVRTYRRVYPRGARAANVVGYIGKGNTEASPGPAAIANWSGKAGIERQCETTLRATPGAVIEHLDVRGRVRHCFVEHEATAGADVTLTIDSTAQQAVERLLDEACERRLPHDKAKLLETAGAAAVVIDIHRGDLLVGATAPRFDPNGFVRQESAKISTWLSDPAAPMMDRCTQMALPPGSVFKIVTAAAILDAGLNPSAPVDCQGYLHQPEALRCAIFRRSGVGHGPVNLTDALTRSCNVYFFHHADQIGSAHLLDWASRFGLGKTSNLALSGEAIGNLPNLAAKTDPKPLSIGQGELTTTPLQMARVAAAIANGGHLVTPRIAHNSGETHANLGPASVPIPGLTTQRIESIRDGLRQAVADEQGTAYATVNLAEVAIAGKTGTAQAGGTRPDHSWFVGYAPAHRPRVAFAIVVEYAGDGAIAAGPVAKQIVLLLNQLGYFREEVATCQNSSEIEWRRDALGE